MSQTVLMVSEQRLKQWTSLDNNTRDEEITPSILDAQNVYVQQTLGTPLYNHIKEGILNTTLNADEILLLNEYIAPALMQYSLYLMLPNIKYKIVEKGILNGTSEETQPTSLDELKYLRQSTLDLAQFYDARLREFLCDADNGVYPLYDNPTPKDGMLPDKKSPYNSGLVTNFRRYDQYPYYKTVCECDGQCSCS
jgi:hypothetical protein